MAAKFSLSDSLAERQKITNAQYREIERLYKDLAKRAAKEAERLKSSTVSGKLQAVELEKLEKKLQEEAEKIGARLESAIPSAMKKAAAGVVSDAASFQDKLGISIEGAYRRVPTDIVETLVSGKLYKGKWSLSKSIWADISKTQSDISKVVAEGIALNKSSYDIAKDLEMYVDPSAKKPWDWSKVYPGTKKKIDYNAQRLARTMVGHAYQQSVVAVCKDDPFVDGIEWISGHSTTTCELCRDRNGKVFPAGKLPLDHPNGKCSFAPHVSKSLSQIGDDLADWVQGKPNKGMDKWFQAATASKPKMPTKTSSGASYDYKKAIAAYDPNVLARQEGYMFGYDKGFPSSQYVTEGQYNKNVDKWAAYVTKQIEKGTPSMQVNSNSLLGVLKDGKFKTVYQTGVTDWKADVDDYLKHRMDTEKSMFGVDDPKSGSPTYCYINSGQQIREEYGDIRISFKRSILDKSTFTVGDSIEGRAKPFLLGDKLTAENLVWNQPYDSTVNAKKFDYYAEYIEVQYHSTLTTEDIEEVILLKKHDKSLEQALEDAGIPWRVGK